jgi:hypothetical protein
MIVRMHLTTEEVALGGVVIGALIAALSGTIRDRSNEHRNHRTHLWEREIEVYESLLLEVHGMRQIRNDIRLKFDGYGDGRINFPLSGLDELATKRLPIQLEMFGRSNVQTAYKECERLLKELIIVLAQLKNSSDNIAEVETGKLPQDQKVSREEVVGQRTDLFMILDAGDEAEHHLAKTIGDAVQRMPTARRKRLLKVLREKSLPTSAVKIDLKGDRG